MCVIPFPTITINIKIKLRFKHLHRCPAHYCPDPDIDRGQHGCQSSELAQLLQQQSLASQGLLRPLVLIFLISSHCEVKVFISGELMYFTQGIIFIQISLANFGKGVRRKICKTI